MVYSDTVISAIFSGSVAPTPTPPAPPPPAPPSGGQQPVAFNINPANGDVQMGTTKDITIEGLTEGASHSAESKNPDKVTVAKKGDNQYTITPKAEGAFTIEVKGTKEGMTETKKSYTGNVTAAAKPQPQPVAFNLNPAAINDLQMTTTRTVQVEGATDGAAFAVESKNADKVTAQIKYKRII